MPTTFDTELWLLKHLLLPLVNICTCQLGSAECCRDIVLLTDVGNKGTLGRVRERSWLQDVNSFSVRHATCPFIIASSTPLLSAFVKMTLLPLNITGFFYFWLRCECCPTWERWHHFLLNATLRHILRCWHQLKSVITATTCNIMSHIRQYHIKCSVGLYNQLIGWQWSKNTVCIIIIIIILMLQFPLCWFVS